MFGKFLVRDVEGGEAEPTSYLSGQCLRVRSMGSGQRPCLAVTAVCAQVAPSSAFFSGLPTAPSRSSSCRSICHTCCKLQLCTHTESTFATFLICRNFLSYTDECAPPDSNSKLFFALKTATRCRASPGYLHLRIPYACTTSIHAPILPPYRHPSTASMACSHGRHFRSLRHVLCALMSRRLLSSPCALSPPS